VTTIDSSKPLTARDVFFDGDAASTAALEKALEEHDLLDAVAGHVKTATPVTKNFVLKQAAQAIDDLLGALHVDDLLIGGWAHVQELQAAIEATSEGGVRHVALASHSIASEHAPSLDLMVNEMPVRLLDLRVALGFVVDACELVVRDGKIDGVEVGSMSADGKLDAAAQTIVQRSLPRLDVSRLFRRRAADTPGESAP
jgi:hypothetical protein